MSYQLYKLGCLFYVLVQVSIFFVNYKINVAKCEELKLITTMPWGSVNGRQVQFLVDTGIRTTCASEEVVRRYCDEAVDEDGCDNAHVELKGFKVSLRIWILENWDGEEYIILGRDFISAVGEVTYELGSASGGWNLYDVYTQGTFNEKDAKFLIDTGCRGDSALIRWERAEKFCNGRVSNEGDTTNFGGRDVRQYGYCYGDVKVLGKSFIQRFRVIEDIGQEDVLLCLDIIRQLGSLTFRLNSPESARLITTSDNNDVSGKRSSNDGSGGSRTLYQRSSTGRNNQRKPWWRRL